MKMEKHPLVSVIIGTRNNADEIFEKCLKSVKNQSYKNVELIVVDNNSTDKTKEIAKNYTKSVYNIGPERSTQRNFGIKKAKGEYILSVDSDQELPENLIEECIKEIPGKDAILIEDDGIGTTFWSKAHTFEKTIHFGDENVTSPRFFRRDKFLEIGGFDENLVLAEDLDLFMRMKDSGFKTGHIDTLFTHYEGGDLKDVFNKSFYYGTTVGNFLKKNPGRGLRVYFVYHPLVYLKNWKYFAQHPIYGSASLIRKFVTYFAGFMGLIDNSLKNNLKVQLSKSVVSDDPSYIIFYVTSKCNSKCKYCFYWKNLNKKQNELTLSEIQDITKNFKNLLYVSLTGGEPFLREDIDKIGHLFYRNSGTKFLAIPTNGILSEKIRDKVLDILKTSPGIHLSIELSVDAIGEKHDKIRGVKGNFEKVLKTLSYLKEIKKTYPNLRIIIHSVFSAYNQDHVKELYDYFKERGIDQYRIGLIRRDAKLKDSIKIDFKKYNDFRKYIEKNKIKGKGIYSKIFSEINTMNREINLRTLKEKKMILPCVGGKKMLIIGEEGDVYPCEMLSKKLGNLKDYDYDINRLLKSKQAREVRKFIVETKCHCDWGCATQNNIIFNKRTYPKLIYRLLR